MSFLINLNNLNDTQKLAGAIASILKKGHVVLLRGELGSGKTTFTRFLIGNFIENMIVSSPTFGIVNVYEGRECELWHYDLYRVKHSEELFELGLDDAFRRAITIIEWPEIIADIISNDGIEIHMKYKDGSDNREAEITLLGELSTRTEDVKRNIERMYG